MRVHRVFDPASYLREGENAEGRAVIIVLNQPIHSKTLLEVLWWHSSYTIAADGGANRLLALEDDPEADEPLAFVPDIILGDLDSLEAETRRFYEERGIDVTRDPDQYSTDFGKAVKWADAVDNGDSKNYFVIGSLSGRVDQGIGLLHEIYREFKDNPDRRLWLWSEQSVSFILPSGGNLITTDLEERFFTRNIGILPIFGPSVITTEGLEWDVEDWKTAMGEQVSTSNHIVEKEIRIQ